MNLKLESEIDPRGKGGRPPQYLENHECSAFLAGEDGEKMIARFCHSQSSPVFSGSVEFLRPSKFRTLSKS